jgi:molecular chaperone DnaK
MVKEAAIYAEEDGKRREEAQARNKANIELDTAEKTLRELSDRIPIEQQRRLRDCIERLRMSLQTYDTQKIKEDTKTLQDAMFSMSTEAYLAVGGDRVAGAAGKYAPSVGKIETDEPSEDDLFGWFKK